MSLETRKKVAKSGGIAVSRDRNHMAEIGRKGGMKTSEDREHMSMIGKKGGGKNAKKTQVETKN